MKIKENSGQVLLIDELINGEISIKVKGIVSLLHLYFQVCDDMMQEGRKVPRKDLRAADTAVYLFRNGYYKTISTKLEVCHSTVKIFFLQMETIQDIYKYS